MHEHRESIAHKGTQRIETSGIEKNLRANGRVAVVERFFGETAGRRPGRGRQLYQSDAAGSLKESEDWRAKQIAWDTGSS